MYRQVKPKSMGKTEQHLSCLLSLLDNTEVGLFPELEIITWIISELYLEELNDRVEDTSVECQTDAFLDKPATPLFIPAKSGKDVATQIEEGEVLHLFIFPLLHCCAMKTIQHYVKELPSNGLATG